MQNTIADYDPITRGFGFIEAPAPAVARLIQGFLTEFRLPRRVPQKSEYELRHDVGHTLPEAFRFLLPLTREFGTRTLILQTANEWSVFFHNRAADQVDPALNEHLSQALNTRAVLAFHKNDTVRKVDHRIAGVPGGTIFHLYEKGTLKRLLSCINDSPWVFDQMGEPLPFEKMERYNARRKRDRFDFELLKDYLGHLGLRPYDDGFFRFDTAHPPIGIEFKTTDPTITLSTVTLDELRREEDEPIG